MLTPKEVAVLRSLKKTSIVLLLIFRLDRPVGRNEIASILDLDPATASNYLKSLSRLGLINRTDYRDGYILTAGGRQLVLGQSQNLSRALSPVYSGTQDAADNAQQDLRMKAQSPVNPGTAVVADSAQQDLSETIDPGDSKVEISPFQRGFSPLSKEEEEESINLIKESSSSSSTKVEISPFRKIPSMAILLNFSNLLFGEGNHVRDFGLPARPPEIVLGWLAQAYSDRSKLSKPAGLAYLGMKRGDVPRTQYMEHPESYLPADFLQAVGLESVVKKNETESIEDAESYGDPAPEARIEDPSIDQLVGKFTPRKAWKTVLDQLQMEMPKATFDTWVSDTWPMRYETPGTMVVGAPNAYAREWLAGRLTSTVTRLLTGLFNRSVDVKFEHCE